jgi:hypothetical protein
MKQDKVRYCDEQKMVGEEEKEKEKERKRGGSM